MVAPTECSERELPAWLARLSPAEVLHDDFNKEDLRTATERHNETCVRGCRYGL